MNEVELSRFRIAPLERNGESPSPTLFVTYILSSNFSFVLFVKLRVLADACHRWRISSFCRNARRWPGKKRIA